MEGLPVIRKSAASCMEFPPTPAGFPFQNPALQLTFACPTNIPSIVFHEMGT
jgi:hypothetical protein